MFSAEGRLTDTKTNNVPELLISDKVLRGAETELTVATCPGQTEEEKLHVSSKETSRLIFLQVLPPYLLAGLGMVAAGMLLDRVQVRDGQIA